MKRKTEKKNSQKEIIIRHTFIVCLILLKKAGDSIILLQVGQTPLKTR